MESSRSKIESFIRPDLLKFGGYSAATAPETLDGKIEVPAEKIIKLDANENPYGCSPAVNRALAEFRNYNIYPDNGQEKLRELFGALSGAKPENIVAAGGSNQLIDLTLRLLLSPGDEVINCTPTFGIYSFSTDLCGGRVVEVKRDNAFTVNVSTVKSAVSSRTKMIFLANPNNPTGNLTPRKDVISLLETGVPVMVDEAYYEFSRETFVDLMGEYGNLMVLRTFSKWAGLAGLRIGYGIFPEVIAACLQRIKIPYNVNVAAIVAIEESLKDRSSLMHSVNSLLVERERLWRELAKLGWLKPYPTSANFILCRVMKGNAKDLQKKLQNKGILVRYFEQPVISDCIRISVGKPEHTDALLKALTEIGG